MPVKKMNGGTTITVDEVFDVAEMYKLAEEWSRRPYEFEKVQLQRYLELCAQYGVDSAVLLYTVQTSPDRVDRIELTRQFPAVGDLPDAV